MAPHVHISLIRSPDITSDRGEVPDLSNDRFVTSSCPVFTEALKIRKEVFVDEQKFDRNLELDNYETTAWHWVAFVAPMDDKKNVQLSASNEVPDPAVQMKPAGTIRLVTPTNYEPESIEFLPWDAMKDIKKDAVAEAWSEGFAAVREKLPLLARVTRLAVLADSRSLGLGRLLVAALEQEVEKSGRAWKAEMNANGKDEVILFVHGQTSVVPFYEKLGYTVDSQMGGGSWLEDGIEHVGLWKRIPVA